MSIYKYIDKPYTISYKKGNTFDTFRYGIESNGIITRQNAHISPFTVKLNKGERLYLSPQADEHFVCDIQIELGSAPTAYEPYHEQTVTLPYTLNAIPVTSGGNVTIDGQQYVADYVDVERGKLVRMVGEFVQNNQEWRKEKASTKYAVFSLKTAINNAQQNDDILNYCSNYFKCIATKDRYSENTLFINVGRILVVVMPFGTIIDDFLALIKGKLKVFYELATPTETDLTADEIAAFKAFASYYPVTNVSTTSDQLDGHTVFNYPISLANGWNYVKQQIGDTREYLYGIDLMTAEAYVNSEYAAALAEIEV